MPRILHILTRPDDALTRGVIQRQEEDPQNKIVVSDLTQPWPDYRGLLGKIFEADSVQTW
jgi:hypothetical protein